MTPEEVEVGKVIAGWIAVVAAAASGAAVAAWRARGRKDSRSLPQYSGASDDAPRRISQKEWRVIAERVQAYEWKVDLLAKDDERLTTELSALREDFDEHVSDSAKALQGFERLDERFIAHQKRWEEVGVRAAEDRREILKRMDSIDTKLDRDRL